MEKEFTITCSEEDAKELYHLLDDVLNEDDAESLLDLKEKLGEFLAS